MVVFGIAGVAVLWVDTDILDSGISRVFGKVGATHDITVPARIPGTEEQYCFCVLSAVIPAGPPGSSGLLCFGKAKEGIQ